MLSRIGFRNFRSIGNEPVEIDLTKKINVLIGANNAGKSTVLEACHRWSQYGFQWRPLDEIDCHKRQNTLGVGFIVEGDWTHDIPQRDRPKECARRFEFEFASNDLHFRVTPFGEIAKANVHQFALHMHALLHQRIEGRPTQAQLDASVPALSHAAIRKIGDPPKFIKVPAIRQISEGDYGLHGAGIVKRLAHWQTPVLGREEDRKKFDSVMRFVRHLIEMDDIDLDIPPGNQHLIVRRGELRLPLLENYGTGVHQLVILAVAVLEHEDTLVAIEEPETHLHPRLQRELLRFLIDETKNKYLITTHSPAFLSRPRDCHIVRMWLEDGVTRSKSVGTTAIAIEVLRDLGVSAADIMQTRFVIWVEGPSDAIYLRRWLELAHQEGLTAEMLTEGIDFSIVFYGGSCLTHLSAEREQTGPDEDDREAKKLIEILRVNQNAAIVIDSDRDGADGKINAVKLRIESECKTSSVLCWITNGHEIENYVPAEAITKVYEAELSGTIMNLSFGQWDRLEEQIKLGIAPDEWRPKFGYGERKPSRAHQFVPHIASLDGLDLRERITQLIKAIQAAK